MNGKPKKPSSETPAATVEERLQAAEAERDQANTDLKAARERITSLEANVETITGERDNARERVTTLEADLVAAQSDRDTAQSRVTELEAEARTAEERAQKILAESGHPPVNTGGDGGGSAAGAGGTLMEQYNAIEDPREKTAFFRKNKAAMIAESRKSAT